MKVFLTAIILAFTGGALFVNLGSIPDSFLLSHTASRFYREAVVTETGALNTVSAILYDFRAFDSLGESTVIFATVSGIVLLLSRKTLPVSSAGLSLIVKRTFGILTPFVFLLSVYIILHGHLSPGGGFQGGVLLAVITIIFCIIYGSSFDLSRYPPQRKTLIETTGALLFLGVGIIGIALTGSFLGNPSAWRGVPGTLPSAGSIVPINLGVGLKVGAGLAIIFYSMIQKTLKRQ